MIIWEILSWGVLALPILFVLWMLSIALLDSLYGLACKARALWPWSK